MKKRIKKHRNDLLEGANEHLKLIKGLKEVISDGFIKVKGQKLHTDFELENWIKKNIKALESDRELLLSNAKPYIK